jgi:hypothetical protein
VNANICLRFSISASIGGIPEYQETITASTDGFGMVNVVIGAVNPSGFAGISWVTGTKYLKVELDHTGLCTGSNTFSGVSEQPFTTVPFALYALNSGSGGGGGSSTTTLTGDVSGSGTGSVVTTLATSGVTAGVYGSATAVPTITVDDKGRITSATTTPIAASSPIGSALNNGNIIIGDGSNIATAVPVTGDVSISNTGASTITTNAVTSAKIFDGTIATVDIANDAVTNNKIANDAVTSTKILNGEIINADINTSANIAYSKLNLANSIVATDLTVDAVENAKIKSDAVTNNKIANDAVTSAKILNGTITNDDISNGAAIQTSKIKGFYTGIFSIPSGSSGGASILVDVDDLIPSLSEIYSTTTIIFQSKSSSIMVKSSEPSDSDGDGTYDQILINFNASFATNQQFSYIIVLN